MSQWNTNDNQQQNSQDSQQSNATYRVFFECRDAKIWTYTDNIIGFEVLKEFMKSNEFLKTRTIPLDENKSDITNLLDFVSNKRYIDDERLGDLLISLRHEQSITTAEQIIIKAIEEKVKSRKVDDKIEIKVTGYKKVMIVLISKTLLKYPHVKIDDVVKGADRFILYYPKQKQSTK
jgi:hypothetical protein